ncbi:MAG: potassium channel family protein [Candidatus Dormibacteraceae bacterium]
MNVLIFGCGRTGATLALQLANKHSVTIIEQNPEALRRLGIRHNCRIIIGSGIDEDVLGRAGIDQADVFVAVTRGDNSNLMAAQIAHMKYKVPKVCVKVADPHRAEAYREMGYFCITPSALLAGMMREWINEEPYLEIESYNVLPAELRI